MELTDILNEIKEKQAELRWEGTFAEYFQMVVKNPHLARLAHARVYDMIQNAGMTTDRWGQPQFSLFSDELFGIENSIAQVVEYFGAAARRLETRKRILLLMGPPASGKTTLANLIKLGLERYTRTDAGALYAIRGCPIQEEPLHLIPPEFRDQLSEQYGLHIEGELCPHCHWMLNHEYAGDINKVVVRRIIVSEQMGIGIGTFVATDAGSRDLTRLTGSVDARALDDDRIGNFGKAFRLNGELNVANRGLMEFVEIFKLDERFLAVLLVLTEEEKIKAPGVGTIYADEAILAHSNEAEYEAMARDPKTEALRDRIVVVRVPYNLRVSAESSIYQKLMDQVDLKGTHIAPLSLPVASIFAVLSRLQPSERYRIAPIKKMRLYDGQYVEGYTAQDAQELRDESPREGFVGISPRFVINQIARAVSRSGVHCLDPIDLLMTLWQGLEQSVSLSREEHKRLYDLFQETRSEYDEMAKRELQKAFVENFDQAATSLVKEYVNSINTYLAGHNGHQGVIGQSENSGEILMRSIERVIHVHDMDSDRFRREIGSRARPLLQAERPIDYHLDARLEEALVRRLCPPARELANVLAPRDTLRPELLAKRDEIMQHLVRERGYEPDCAQHLMDHVAGLLSQERRNKTTLPQALHWLHG